MTFEETKNTSIDTINNIFLEEMRNNFPSNLFQKYQNELLKMVNKEITPICLNIMEKNKEKLEVKFNEIIQKENISDEEKQIKFNEELNSMFNLLGKAKMTQKAFVVQKNGINMIKYNEGQFSKKKNKREKEEKEFIKLKNVYDLTI